MTARGVLVGVRSSPRATWEFWRFLRRRKIPVYAVVILVVLVIAGLGALAWTPHDPRFGSLAHSLRPPLGFDGALKQFPLGTDFQGRDILSRMLAGSTITLVVLAIVTLGSTTFGTFMGLLAGYFGGWIDIIIMRVVDIKFAIPALIIALVIAATLGPSIRNVILVIVIVSWAGYARQVRGEVLSQKERDYVLAVRAMGATNMRIMVRHILPNVMATILVLATLQAGTVILTEASLSFLGVGVPPPAPAWGVIISNGRSWMPLGAWWISVIPGVAMAMTILSLNMLGDWVRDVLDPTLRHT